MGVRIGYAAIAFCVLSSTGCGIVAPPPAEPAPSVPVEMAAPSPSRPTEPTPYVNAEPQLAALAALFVRESLSYDSCASDRSAFPERVAAMATGREVRRLRASERAHLRWWVLCQRNEQATVQIHGITQSSSIGPTRTVYVEAVRTTRSDISTVRDFLDIRLSIVLTSQGWRVASARGGGL